MKVIRDLAKQRKLEVYLVGGFLRDHILGSSKTDFDFAVSRGAVQLARLFSGKIKGAYILLDDQRGCARVCKKIKGELYTFDFADFRAKTFKDDLGHRDFTINTLSLDLLSLEEQTTVDEALVDLKRGLKDIKEKKIKMVSVRAFREDPLRMLRAFSLKAAWDLKIEPETLERIKKDKDLMRGVSYERIRDEMFKILAAPKGAHVLKDMDRCGLLDQVIPQIRVMYTCQQGTYHHLDVWPHSLETVVQVEGVFKQFEGHEEINAYLDETFAANRTRRVLIKLACLLHDIGKPDTRRTEDGRVLFHGHEHVGAQIVRSIAKMMKISIKERYALEAMVRWHLRPGYLSNFKNPSQRAIYRYFRDTHEEAVSILLLSLADQRSTRGPATTEYDQKHHEEICLRLMGEYFDRKKQQPFTRLINGDDLIRRLKLKPSPLFNIILTEIEEKQSLGEIKTKKEALAKAEEIAARHPPSQKTTRSTRRGQPRKAG